MTKAQRSIEGLLDKRLNKESAKKLKESGLMSKEYKVNQAKEIIDIEFRMPELTQYFLNPKYDFMTMKSCKILLYYSTHSRDIIQAIIYNLKYYSKEFDYKFIFIKSLLDYTQIMLDIVDDDIFTSENITKTMYFKFPFELDYLYHRYYNFIKRAFDKADYNINFYVGLFRSELMESKTMAYLCNTTASKNENLVNIEFLMKFDKDQFFVINRAALMGLTPTQVAVFAKPELNSRQMEHIMYAIIDGMNNEWAELIADTKFCYPQMIAIKSAYDANIPFEYVKENYTPDRTYVEMGNITKTYIAEHDRTE